MKCIAIVGNKRLSGELIKINERTIIMKIPDYVKLGALEMERGKYIKRHKIRHKMRFRGMITSEMKCVCKDWEE